MPSFFSPPFFWGVGGGWWGRTLGAAMQGRGSAAQPGVQSKDTVCPGRCRGWGGKKDDTDGGVGREGSEKFFTRVEVTRALVKSGGVDRVTESRTCLGTRTLLQCCSHFFLPPPPVPPCAACRGSCQVFCFVCECVFFF